MSTPTPHDVAMMAYRVTLAMLSADDGVQARGVIDQATGAEEVIQAESLDMAAPYGLWGSPPPDTELIAMRCEAGDVAIGARYPRPSALSNAGAGQAALYDSAGQLIWMATDAGIEIRPKSGQKAKVSSDGRGTKKVGLHGDAVNKVGKEAGFEAWMLAVEALAESGQGGTCQPSASAITQIGELVASAAELEAK